jgi:hypothetical protein
MSLVPVYLSRALLAIRIAGMVNFVKIILDKSIDPYEAIIVSQGCERTTDIKYASPAYIPKVPFRKATSDELSHLLHEPYVLGAHDCVQVKRLSFSVSCPFMKGISDLSLMDRDEVARFVGSGVGQYAYNQFLRDLDNEFFGSLRVNVDRSHVAGICVKQPGLVTLTTSNVEGLFVGMHVDDSYGYPFGLRWKAPLRICANFGLEDRTLLFLPELVDSISKELEHNNLTFTNAKCLSEYFLNLSSEKKVYGIRVRPGEAYVAPTENLIHDATTLASTGTDIAFHALGRLVAAS